MRNSKRAWLFVLVAVLAAFAAVGIRACTAAKDPSSAFDGVRQAAPSPRTARYYSDDEAQNSGSATQSPTVTQTPNASTPTPAPEFAKTGQRVTVTLLGLDSDEAREAAKMGKRSDTIALLSVDLDSGACSVLSVPRDTRAKVRRLDKSGSETSVRWDKINAAYAYGGGNDENSANNSLFALSELLGTQLYYYAVIDMDSIAPIVEAVGGVTVTLEHTIEGVGEEGETVTLDGETAYVFIRRRKGLDDGSDVARTARQRQFMKALAGRMQQLDIASAFPALWGAVSQNVQTNLSFEQMIALAFALKDMDVENIDFSVLPGRPKTIRGKSYYIMDEDKAREVVEGSF